MDKKQIEKYIELITAFKDGKQLQMLDLDDGTWCDVTRVEQITTAVNTFRYKPESKARPYTFEELKEACYKHRGMVIIKNKKCCYAIGCFNTSQICINSFGETYFDTYEEFLKYYKWYDDNSVCGVEEDGQ